MKSQTQLSRPAIDKFKLIYQKEFGQNLTDDETQEIALPFLHLFRILLLRDKTDPSKPHIIDITDEEFQALKYIHFSVRHNDVEPTVRGISVTLGRRSSKTGVTMIANLIKKGWVYRNEKGQIRMPEHLLRCQTGLHEK